MLRVDTVKGNLKIVVEAAGVKRQFDITNLEGVALEEVMLSALDFHQSLMVRDEVSLVDTLFRNGVPLYIQMRKTESGRTSQFILQINRNPITGVPFDRTITASASIGQYGIEAAFEVVWSRLELALGLFEVPGVYPLKCAALAHFKHQKLFGR